MVCLDGQVCTNVLAVLSQDGYGVTVIKVLLAKVTDDVSGSLCRVGCLCKVGRASPGLQGCSQVILGNTSRCEGVSTNGADVVDYCSEGIRAEAMSALVTVLLVM